MEPERSLPHSQEPDNCPYPEPARSSSYHHIPHPEDTSYYYPPIYAWVVMHPLWDPEVEEIIDPD